ncbi:MAG TPA: hypothetical protein VF796_25930, partial [Humisphaera sp.]
MPRPQPNVLRPLAVALLSLVALAAAGSTASAVDLQAADLDPGGWAMDPASGRVFASDYGGKRVVEFDPVTGRPAREFQLSAEHPRDLVVKKGKLVVAVESGVAVHVIDLATNQVEGRVQLAGRGPSHLFCSEADNPWVYAVCNTGDAWWDGEVFQVDVLARRSRKSVKVQGWRQSAVRQVAMAPDGRSCVVTGFHSPSRADLMTVDEEAMTFRDVFGYHESFGPIRPHPTGRFWTFGNALYSQDIRKRIREYRGSVLAAHPSLDLVAGLRAGGLGRAGGLVVTLQTFGGPEVLSDVTLA